MMECGGGLRRGRVEDERIKRAVRGSGEGHNVGVAADWQKKWRGRVRKSEGRGRGRASRSLTHAT